MNTYTEALNKAKQELWEVVRKRDEYDRRITALQTTIDALSSLSNSSEQSSEHPKPEITIPGGTGISDAIRLVLQRSPEALTAPLIRDRLSASGYDVSRYVSVLTVIHNTVKRMDDQGEIFKVTKGGRVVGWRYRRPALSVN
jgi:hypothetical protein